MKVLVCIPCLLNGGTEVQTLSLVEALVKAGHKPIVACYFEYDSEMIERYHQAGAEVRLLSKEGKRPLGIKNTVKHLWIGLRSIVKSESPDVAHVQYMAPGALPIILLRAMGVKKIIATTHTPADIYSSSGLRLIKLLSRICVKGFQCITLLAERSYFGSASMFDGTLKPHFTIYNGLPSHIQIVDASRSFSSEIITIGVVSRLAEIKGMDLVIPAFNEARKNNSRLRLLIVGDGNLRTLMEQQRIASPYYTDIEFVGMRRQSELQQWYDRIDILLMPSRSEGFGLTAIEGMARGCVPVVANVGGLPEVVTNDCGLRHEPENINDIANRIIECIACLKDKSDAAITRAKQFSSIKYNNSIQGLYDII